MAGVGSVLAICMCDALYFPKSQESCHLSFGWKMALVVCFYFLHCLNSFHIFLMWKCSLSPQLPHPLCFSPFTVWFLHCWPSLGNKVSKILSSKHLKGCVFRYWELFSYLHVSNSCIEKDGNSWYSAFLPFFYNIQRCSLVWSLRAFYIWYRREGNDRKVTSD